VTEHNAAPAAALQRLSALLLAAERAQAREHRDGYLDLLGDSAVPSPGGGQDLMHTGLVPLIYERWWRPALGRVAKGALGPSMQDEHRIAIELLELGAGDLVLDVACGPGNFTRRFGARVGARGLAVGLDGSQTMLARAVADTRALAGRGADNVAYVRGDAAELPFKARSFDAVCCFAALNMMAQPFAAIDAMTRVLKRGARIALFTSCARGPAPRSLLQGVVGAASGMTVFGRDELTGALAARGFQDVTQRVAGITQFVGGRRG